MRIRKPMFVRMRTAEQLSLSVSVSDVLDAFYEDFATLDSGRYWWWCQMILLDPNELIVNDGTDDLYRIAFTTADNGPGNEPTVTFGDPTPIRLEPVDSTIAEESEAEPATLKREYVLAACQGIASTRGPERVAASYKSREESRPKARMKEEKQVNEYIKRLRAKLGLAADVPDEKVLELAATRLEAEPEPEPETTPDPNADPDPEADPNADPEDGEQQQQQPPEPAGLRSVRVSDDTLATLQAEASMGREARLEQLRTQDESFIDEHIRAGRIPARSKPSYLKQMGLSESNRKDVRAFILSLDENVIPVEMRGTADNSNGGGQHVEGSRPDLDAFLSAHMPDVASRKQRLLASVGSDNRIHSDKE